jgi:DNA (cytosine-5)-methyltransferase 1
MKKQFKVLNLYAGIGGNRRLWGDEHQITAVELDDKRAKEYSENFPNDTVIVDDAHQYLLDNYKEFDFIWTSPPCQSHSTTNYFLNAQGVIRYPDMKLWQEIIFLKHFCKSKWCVENVKPYYGEIMNPKQIGRHFLWSNFFIPTIAQPEKTIGRMCGAGQSASKKRVEERNEVNSELGLHIFETALGIIRKSDVNQTQLFE